MEQNHRLEALDENNWVYNGTDFPSVVFLAHYFPYTLISARNVLPKRKEWLTNENNEHTEQILQEVRATIPDESLLKPRDMELAKKEFEVAKEVAKVLESMGGEVGSGCDQEWNPFRKDVEEFEVMQFLRDCGVSDDYLNSKCTVLKTSLKDFIIFFNELLNHDIEDDQLLNENLTLDEAISSVSKMSDDVQYKQTISNYLNALSMIHKHSGNYYYTQSGYYTSRGIDVRFVFGHKSETNTVFGCFQVLYLS